MAATLVDALRLALDCHGDTLDKAGREPYLLHPLRVMLAQRDEHARIAAVLHDTVEDTALTLEQVAAAGFAPEVVRALRLLTHDDDTPYEHYVRRLKPDPVARQVKIADLEDNMDVRRLDRLSTRDHQRLDRYLAAWRELQEADRE